jgi:hypothetical protein
MNSMQQEEYASETILSPDGIVIFSGQKAE